MTTPLLLLHGALGSAAQMSELQKILATDRPVHTISLPGHGGRTVEGAFSMELFARAVLDFLEKEKIERVDLFGYSMGGYLALWLAWKYPERVGQVITLGTKLDWTPESAAAMKRMFDPEKIALKVPLLAEYLAAAHAPLDWKVLCRQTSDFLHTLGEGAGIPNEAYPRIACTVHIGWGDADQVVSREESEAVATLLPAGHLRVVAGVPHGIEQSEQQVADYIREVLK